WRRGDPPEFSDRNRTLRVRPVPRQLSREVDEATLRCVCVLEDALAAAETPITAQLAAEPCAAPLRSAPRVGPITAATFIAAIDTPTRFANAGRVAAIEGEGTGSPASTPSPHGHLAASRWAEEAPSRGEPGRKPKRVMASRS